MAGPEINNIDTKVKEYQKGLLNQVELNPTQSANVAAAMSAFDKKQADEGIPSEKLKEVREDYRASVIGAQLTDDQRGTIDSKVSNYKHDQLSIMVNEAKAQMSPAALKHLEDSCKIPTGTEIKDYSVGIGGGILTGEITAAGVAVVGSITGPADIPITAAAAIGWGAAGAAAGGASVAYKHTEEVRACEISSLTPAAVPAQVATGKSQLR